MLGELDGGVAVDDEEVDLLGVIGLFVAALAFALAAGELGDLGVEAGLGHLHDAVEAREDLAAAGGVHVLDEAQHRGGDKEVAALHGDLGLVHGACGGAQGGNDAGAVGKRGGGGADAGGRGVAGEAEGVQLGHHAGADELAGEAAEGDARGLGVVQRVDGEHAAAVEVANDRLVGQRDVAVHVAAGAAVVGQAVHGHLGDDELPGVGARARQLGRAVQERRARGLPVDLVENGNILLEKCDGVGQKKPLL